MNGFNGEVDFTASSPEVAPRKLFSAYLLRQNICYPTYPSEICIISEIRVYILYYPGQRKHNYCVNLAFV